jgi:hypothetical protein
VMLLFLSSVLLGIWIEPPINPIERYLIRI